MSFWNTTRGKLLQEACKPSAIRRALVPEPNKQTSEDHVRIYEEICISLWDCKMIWAQPLDYRQGGGKLFTLRCEPCKSGGWCILLWALNHASISLSRSGEEQKSGQGTVCMHGEIRFAAVMLGAMSQQQPQPQFPLDHEEDQRKNIIHSLHCPFNILFPMAQIFFHPPLLFMICPDQKSPSVFFAYAIRTLNGLKHLYHFKVDWGHENSSQDVSKLGFQTVHQLLDSHKYIVCHVLCLTWEWP